MMLLSLHRSKGVIFCRAFIIIFFAFQLIAVLREVKYLENAQNETLESIPESATGIYSRNETFHKFLSNLDLTVAWYNKIRETLLDVEFPLVEGQLQEIDNQLQQAETTLNWNSEGLCLFITEQFSNDCRM